MPDTVNMATPAGVIKIGDLKINRLGLGTNRITDTDEARELLERAVEVGINFIDTAYLYQGGDSEVTIGKTLAPYPNGLVIATKGGYDGASPEQLREELETSMQRLQTDFIELYQLHRVDPSVPLETSVKALKQFQQEGKIGYIGLSEVTVEQIEEAQRITPIASVQNEYNLADRKHEAVLDYCTQHAIAFIPWYPLGGRHGGNEKISQLTAEMAEKYNVEPLQIALAWMLKRSSIMLPIPGTLSIEHMEANLRAAEIELDEEDYQQLLNAA